VVERLQQDEVLRLFDEGVHGFVRTAEGLAPGGWERRACGTWSAAELARHVLAVACWYHEWLDRAEAGDAAVPFPADELARRNAMALEKLAGTDAVTAVVQFAERTRAYGDRLRAAWDLPFGYPRGTVTAGLHAGVAAAEWHLHAWDLAHAAGREHRPSDPAALYTAASACLASAQGGIAGRVTALLIPLGARLRPWEELLRRSGRAPGSGD
jgi:Mycothiol maleylpyruvate isomerase N-terminal domain